MTVCVCGVGQNAACVNVKLHPCSCQASKACLLYVMVMRDAHNDFQWQGEDQQELITKAISIKQS